MKQLFLILLAVVCSNFIFAQSKVVITFDSESKNERNPKLQGVSQTFEGVELGKWVNGFITTYYFGVTEKSTWGSDEIFKKIYKITSYDKALDKTVTLEVYHIEPKVRRSVLKSEDVYFYKQVILPEGMTLRTSSLFAPFAEDELSYSNEKIGFTFTDEKEAQAFIAFINK